MSQTTNRNPNPEPNQKNSREYQQYVRLVNHMQSRITPIERASLRVNFGTPALYTRRLDPLIDFYRVSYGINSDHWTAKLESAFFTACYIAKYDMSVNGTVPMEEILQEEYANPGTSAGTRHKIEDMLSSRMDDRAINIRKLAAIIPLLNKEKVKNVDLAKMLCDLKHWEDRDLDRSGKIRWAGKILETHVQIQADSENAHVPDNDSENKRKYLTQCDNFIKNMLVKSTPTEQSTLKVSLGVPVSNANIATLISYFKVSRNTYYGHWNERLEAAFFTTCLISALDVNENGSIPIELILKDAYTKKNSSDGTKRKIEDMLNTRMDDKAYVLKKLAAIIPLLNKEKVKNIDFAKMLYDLTNWDSHDIAKNGRMHWAESILS